MPRSRSNSLSPRLTRDAARLVALVLALNRSGSRVEDLFWEEQLRTLILKLLRADNNTPLEAALDHLLHFQPGAHEALLEEIETLTEWTVLEKDGVRYDVLLLVAPIIAWTRYSIPTGAIPPKILEALTTQLHDCVLAQNVNLVVMPWLVSVDQMPHSFTQTWQWLQQLGAHALGDPPAKPIMANTTESANLLADTRYLVSAVAVPQGAPMFRWQNNPQHTDTGRDACLSQWTTHTYTHFTTLLPGCIFECLLPDAYYISHHDADRRIRPLTLRAAIAWLETAANFSPSQLRAVIAGCGEQRIDEYRIAFTTRNTSKVIYGCIWPLQSREEALSHEEDTPNPIEEINHLLKELGLLEIRHIPGVLPAEYCEDCAAPYFPSPLGEMVHAELPEEVASTPIKFH